ncbi:MAG TPA: decarboxylating 6-phosphogluconate dehydrogenase [Pseudomonadales bacterium]|nr:decarboxylating 6-phosphogluconate dehydrogenase [Pseudomonadales bacterium]
MSTLGLIGLGRMGGNMARRLQRNGVDVIAFNRNHSVTEALAAECGLSAAASVEELIEQLPAPRVVWLMLPAGDATQQHIDQVSALLSPGDILVDGANSWFKDTLQRAEKLKPTGVYFVDAGVSGGVWGLANGYCIMAGGEKTAIEKLQPVLQALAPSHDTGWLHTGPTGSGHFTKMVHNGIEYGMMQSLAEGFALLKAREDFAIDLAAVAELWRHGSVVRSWLLDLCGDFLKQDQTLDNVAPVVADSGEGRWTALEAIEQGIPAPVMSLALMMRFASQGNSDFGDKMLAKMREGFGGHKIESVQK